MKILKKTIYIIRILFFIIHFLLLYDVIGTLWQVKPLIYFFIVIHFTYVINTILEMLSKKDSYQNDLVYNFMQVGIYIYIFIIFYRIHFTHVFYMVETATYFNINFGILCFLLAFLLIYSHFELKNR